MIGQGTDWLLQTVLIPEGWKWSCPTLQGMIDLSNKKNTCLQYKTIHFKAVPSQDAGWDHIALFGKKEAEKVQIVDGPPRKVLLSRT